MATVSFSVVKDTGNKNLNKLAAELKKSGKYVKVGLPDSPHRDSGLTLAQLGGIHEYGAPGAGIPERPFLAVAIRKELDDLMRLNIINLKLILHNGQTFEGALEQLGLMAQGKVQQYIVDGDFAPLQPATIARKGSSKPLIDTGQMRQSITFVVEGK